MTDVKFIRLSHSSRETIVTRNSDHPTVLCAGDRFITAAALAEAAVRHIDGARTIKVESNWPDEPFGDVDGVREAAGPVSDLVEAIAECDVVLTHLAPITAEVIKAGSHLALIGSVRGGPVNIDVEAASTHGVPVAYIPGRNLQAVAEYTLGMAIALTRNIGAAGGSMAAGDYDASWFRFEKCGPELGSATIGLVGLGAVGQRVAELLAPFGSRVVAYDPYAQSDRAQALGVTLVEMPELLAQSDIVSLHARVTKDNKAMMNAEAFAAMREGSYLINTARGELVDHDALREALASGHLAGAALDVFDPEPPAADDPLRRPPQVLATPHLGGASREVALHSAERIARAAAQFIADGTLEHCANSDTLKGE